MPLLLVATVVLVYLNTGAHTAVGPVVHRVLSLG